MPGDKHGLGAAMSLGDESWPLQTVTIGSTADIAVSTLGDRDGKWSPAARYPGRVCVSVDERGRMKLSRKALLESE